MAQFRRRARLRRQPGLVGMRSAAGNPQPCVRGEAAGIRALLARRGRNAGGLQPSAVAKAGTVCLGCQAAHHHTLPSGTRDPASPTNQAREQSAHSLVAPDEEIVLLAKLQGRSQVNRQALGGIWVTLQSRRCERKALGVGAPAGHTQAERGSTGESWNCDGSWVGTHSKKQGNAGRLRVAAKLTHDRAAHSLCGSRRSAAGGKAQMHTHTQQPSVQPGARVA